MTPSRALGCGDGGDNPSAVAFWCRGDGLRPAVGGVELVPRRPGLRRARSPGHGSTRRRFGLRTVSTMALTYDETAVLKLVAAGALSAHEVSKFGGPDVVRAVHVLVGLERKGLVERRVLRDGHGAVRHAAHFLTPIGQRRCHVA